MADEILLTSDGSQTFSIALDEVIYNFKVSYNTRAGVWATNISTNGVELVNGVVLVGGVDLLRQFTFILQNLFVVNLSNPLLDAGPDNLGTDVKLFKLSDDEVDTLG